MVKYDCDSAVEAIEKLVNVALEKDGSDGSNLG